MNRLIRQIYLRAISEGRQVEDLFVDPEYLTLWDRNGKLLNDIPLKDYWKWNF